MRRNYDDPAYKKWRQDVAKRDGFKCRWPNCNSKSKLQFHHIKRWADYPNLRFDVNNGITLCRKHHDKIWGREEEYQNLFYSILGQTRVQQNIRAELRLWEKNQNQDHSE